MNIEYSLDGVRGGVVITFFSPLLGKYYNNFVGMANSYSLPEGTTITRRGGDCGETAEIFIPSPDMFKNKEELEEEVAKNMDKFGMARVHVSLAVAVKIERVKLFIQRFVVIALRYILNRTEICPVIDFSGGYSFKELREDVVTAVKNKRDILVIDTYESYKSHKFPPEYNQYLLPFGTSEYCDFVLAVRNSNENEVAERYKDKLKRTVWV